VSALTDALAAVSQRFGDREALVDGDLRLTFSDLEERSARLAGFIAGRAAPGRTIAYLGRNSWQLIVAIFACAYARTVLVPVNWRLAADELDGVLADAAPGLIVAGEGVDAARDGAVEVSDPALFAAEPLRAGEAGDREPVVQMYTAGFGGKALGALLTHEGIFVAAEQLAEVNALGADDAYLTTGPLFHIATMVSSLSLLIAGSRVVVMGRFDPAIAAETIERERVTGLFLVEPMTTRLLDAIELRGTDARSLRRGVSGRSAAAVRLRELAGIETWGDVYGQTELTGVVTRPAPGATGTHGRPSPVVEIRIVDDDGEELPSGEVGEIVVRGPMVMLGYANDIAATADKIRNGWLHSYDLGRLEDDGTLSFIGPKRSLIKTGGENVYPAEVEAAIRALPAVAAVCVIGLPHAEWGQIVTGVVSARAGERLTPDDIDEHCRGVLAGYKRPRRIEIVDELPTTADGRVDREAVIARLNP
jgi:acyl-CoA synthetase (AMP-forming)/AMP-acid ligase II